MDTEEDDSNVYVYLDIKIGNDRGTCNGTRITTNKRGFFSWKSSYRII